MKYCPKCQRSYSSSQGFCLEDGEPLVLKDLYGLAGRVVAHKYEIEALAAVGGMSAVYRAHQIGINRPVAFKILLPHIVVNNQNVPALFAREAQLAGRLSHENIATVHDAGQTEEQIAYIVMEWLEGHTLETELRQRQYQSYQRSVSLLRQIAAALDAAHDLNIIHRDLKPSNIMLSQRPDGSERVKVFDFGLAKVVTDSLDIHVSSALGTPHYASPEQFRPGEELSGSADIYALGVILFRMLTGRFPFNGANIHELIRAHLLETPPPLSAFRPQIPLEVETLVTRMLAKTPHYRPTRASEAAQLFEAAVRHLPDYQLSGELINRKSQNVAQEAPARKATDGSTRKAVATATQAAARNGSAPPGEAVRLPVQHTSRARGDNLENSRQTKRLSPTYLPSSTATPVSLPTITPVSIPAVTPASIPALTTTSGTPAITANSGGYAITSVTVNAALPSNSQKVPAIAPSTLPFIASSSFIVSTLKSRFVISAALAVMLSLVAAAGYFLRDVIKLTEKDTILLADIINVTGDEVFDRTLKQALSVQLSQSPFLNLLGEDKVRETLRFMNRKADDRLTRDIAREIAVRQGLKAVITGQINKLDRHYSITLEAINTQDGDSFARTLVEAESKDQVLKALGQASEELRERLGESLSSIQKFNAPIDQATTSSLEALKAYSLGRDQYSLKDNYVEGITLHKRAIELDPNFALAYNGLGVIYMNLGQAELSIEQAEKAYQLRDRVSERERLAISSFYYLITGEVERAIETYRLTVQTYPRLVASHINLSVCFNRLGQLEAALAETKEALKLDPGNGTAYQNGADLLVRLGRYEEAVQLISEAQKRQLDRLGLHATLFQLGFLQGDRALMKAQLDWVKGKPVEFRAAEWQAQTAAYVGQLRAADELCRQAMEVTKQRNMMEVTVALAMYNALRHALAGKTDKAQTLLSEAIALSPQSFSLFSVSKSAPFGPLMLALSGDWQRAQSFEEELVQRQPRNTLANAIWLPLSRAASALHRHQPAQALEALRPVANYEAGAFFYPAWLRGQAHLQLKQSREAAAEFQNILAHRGYEPTAMLYPLAHLGLARALAQAGDTTQSRQHYHEFLTLWKEADADLPVLNAAKREYAALK